MKKIKLREIAGFDNTKYKCVCHEENAWKCDCGAETANAAVNELGNLTVSLKGLPDNQYLDKALSFIGCRLYGGYEQSPEKEKIMETLKFYKALASRLGEFIELKEGL